MTTRYGNQRMMNLDEMRKRLQDRITVLEDRLKHVDPKDVVKLSNVKTELNIAKRRLTSLNEKTKGSSIHETYQSP